MRQSYSGLDASKYPDAGTANITEDLASKLRPHLLYDENIKSRRKDHTNEDQVQFQHGFGAGASSLGHGSGAHSLRRYEDPTLQLSTHNSCREALLAELYQRLSSASEHDIMKIIDYLKHREQRPTPANSVRIYSSPLSEPSSIYAPVSTRNETHARISAPAHTLRQHSFNSQQPCLFPANRSSLTSPPSASSSSNMAPRQSNLVHDSMDTTRESCQSISSANPSTFDIESKSKHSTTTTIASKFSHTSTIPTVESSTSKHSSSCTKRWQCTYGCSTTFGRKHDWIRHELGRHDPQKRYTCLLETDSLSSDICPSETCNGLLMDRHHLQIYHKASFCYPDDSSNENRFCDTRGDKLILHLRERHSLNLGEIPKSWLISCGSKNTYWGCGFCGKHLESWKERANHINDHFEEGSTMKEWRNSLVLEGLQEGKAKEENLVSNRLSVMSLDPQEGAGGCHYGETDGNPGTANYGVDSGSVSPDFLQFLRTHNNGKRLR